MDAEAFLRVVVPAQGIKYLAVLKPGAVRPAHYDFRHHNRMAEAALQFDMQGAEVYFALAAYNQSVQATDRNGVLLFHPDGRPKMLKRTASLAQHVQSFWADLDCGEGKPYTDQQAALVGLEEFCGASQCPAPIVVSSGGGLHCYWAFDQPILADQWKSWAPHWRRVLHHFGLHSDPQRDTDVASILRVPGTHNHKNGGCRPVVVREAAEPSSVRTFFAWLTEKAKVAKATEPKVKPRAKFSVDGLGDLPAHLVADDAVAGELISRAAMPKSSAVEVVKHCQQIRFLSTTGATKAIEPAWRGMLGLAKHCTEGEAIAHAWSEAHPGYTAGETQDKLDRWTAGPPTCAYFVKENPSQCDGCAHYGKITSPIQLGVVQVEAQTLQVEVSTDEGIQLQQFELPRGYLYDSGRRQMCRQIRNDDGVFENIPFAAALFHAVARIRGLDTKYTTRFRVYPEHRPPREFSIPTGEIAAGGANLTKLLGEYEVMPTLNKGAATLRQGYLLEEINRLQREGVEMVTHNQFGWQEGGQAFLYGNKLYRANGPVEALLSDTLASHTEIGPSANANLDAWVGAIDEHYNRPGLLCYQYAIASSFASVLVDFFGADYNGAAMCFTGSTGKGKSTACFAALSVWGDPERMHFARKEGATPGARIGRQGAYQSLPVLHDEVTQMPAEEARSLLYALANGKGRTRLDSTGLVEKTATSWKSHSYLTTNNSINELVTGGKGGDIATAVRNFEVPVDDENIPTLDRTLVDSCARRANANAGTAGEVFIKFVVAHRGWVAKKLFTVEEHLLKKMPLLGTDTRFRMYRMHVQATITALAIARALRLLAFDEKAVLQWALNHTAKLCATAAEADEVKRTSLFEQMLNALATRTLVTDNFHDSRSNQIPEEPRYRPMGDIAGRYVLGTPHMPAGQAWFAGKLILSAKAIREWAMEHGLRAKEILDDADRQGLLTKDHTFTKLALGRGTPYPSLQTTIYIFDLSGVSELRETLKSGEPDPAAA